MSNSQSPAGLESLFVVFFFVSFISLYALIFVFHRQSFRAIVGPVEEHCIQAPFKYLILRSRSAGRYPIPIQSSPKVLIYLCHIQWPENNTGHFSNPQDNIHRNIHQQVSLQQTYSVWTKIQNEHLYPLITEQLHLTPSCTQGDFVTIT